MVTTTSRVNPKRGTFDGLALRMKLYAGAIEKDTIAYENLVTVETVVAIAGRTPVDTGQARSNWRVSVGGVKAGILPPYRPYASRWRPPYPAGGGYMERPNLAGVRQSAEAAVSRNLAGKSVYIVNNLPYIERLDDGYSKQRAHFIADGTKAGLAAANKKFRMRNMDSV